MEAEIELFHFSSPVRKGGVIDFISSFSWEAIWHEEKIYAYEHHEIKVFDTVTMYKKLLDQLEFPFWTQIHPVKSP